MTSQNLPESDEKAEEASLSRRQTTEIERHLFVNGEKTEVL